MRKQVPPQLTKDVVEFSTMKPVDRFESIKKGLQVKNQTLDPNLDICSHRLSGAFLRSKRICSSIWDERERQND